MKKVDDKADSAGESIIRGAKQALAFAKGEKDHGCTVHVPKEIKDSNKR